MEPYNLTLEQVTFDERDLSPNQELDSFSNVVCFDSEFGEKQKPEPSSPSTSFITENFTSPKIKKTPVKRSRLPAAESTLREESFLGGDNRSTSGRFDPEEAGIIPIDYQLHFDDPIVHSPVSGIVTSPFAQKHLDFLRSTPTKDFPVPAVQEAVEISDSPAEPSSEELTESDSAIAGLLALDPKPRRKYRSAKVHCSGYQPLDLPTVNQILAKLQMSAEMDLPSEGGGDPDNQDSFTAFSSTTEALALQKSVIGNTSLAPASADEIARIIALTQAQLQLNTSDGADGDTASQAGMEVISPTASASSEFGATNGDLDEGSINDTDSNSSGLIRIPAAEMMITNTKGDGKVYREPTADIKAKLKAKARANSKAKAKREKKAEKKGDDMDRVPVRENSSFTDSSQTLSPKSSRKTPVKTNSEDRSSGNDGGGDTALNNQPAVERSAFVSHGALGDQDAGAIGTQGAGDRMPRAFKTVEVGLGGKREHSTGHTPPVKDPGFQPIVNPNDYPLDEALKVIAEVRGKDSGTDLQQKVMAEIQGKDSGIDIQQMERSDVVDRNEPDVQPIPVSTSTPATTPGKRAPGGADMNRFGQERSYGLGLFNVSGGFLNRKPAKERNGELDRVLREKAHLEGQIEMLKLEASSAVRERAELQAQLGALKSQLKNQLTGSSGAFKDRDILLGDIRTLKQRRDELEHNISQIKKSLDEKNTENQTLSADLDLSKSANDKLQEKIVELRGEIQMRETVIQELKTKILDINQDLQSVRQEKRQSENEIRSIQNEIGALTKTKDWYQQQLKAAQEARAQLQKELSKNQLSIMEQANQIERLKSEGSQVKLQLSETQQKALQEKELLFDNLERIQADMLEREATMHQMENQERDVEETLQQRIQRVEEEKYKLAHLVSTTGDLEQELLKTRHELEQKESQVGLLEQEHTEMLKKLTLSQEMIAQGQKDYETLEIKFVEAESRLREFKSTFSDKDQEILTLKDQKAALEVALSAANEEKRSIDEALSMLRQDMGRVESTFRDMKQEMNKKALQLEKVEKEKGNLTSELDQTREDLKLQQKSFDEFNSSISDRFVMVNELQEEKQRLETETESLKRELQTLNESLQSLSQEKSLVETELTKAEEQSTELGGHLNKALEEKAILESRIESLLADQEKHAAVSQENETLKSYATELQTKAYGEIMRYQQEVQRLTLEVDKAQNLFTENEQVHGDDVAALLVKLEESVMAQQKAETEMVELNRKIAEGELASKEEEHLRDQVQSLLEKVDLQQQKKAALEAELDNARESSREEVRLHRERITQLEQQLQQAEELFLQQQEAQEENRQLALDLEREKGRLAGVLQSHAALKRHTSELEGALAEKESSIVEVSARTQRELEEVARLAEMKEARMLELEGNVDKEKGNVKDFKLQAASEKLKYSKLRNQNEALKLDYEQLKKEIELSKSDYENLKKNIDSGQSGEMKYKAELDTLRTEYRICQLEVESLQRQLSQNTEKGPVIDETIRTLHWQIEQKDQEVKGLREQLSLAEERQQLEVDNVRKALQNNKEEVDKLRAELSQTRKEKFTYQAKLSELRGAVKASLKGKKGKEDGGLTPGKDESCQANEEDFSYTSALSIVEKILQDNSLPSYNSKPLAALETCLGSLRSEMTNLQKQIDDHTMAVFNSTQSWRQVESHVADLKNLCKSHNGEASSDELQASSQRAEQEIQKLVANDMRSKSKQRQNRTIDV
ncbi:golgin subfamily A member 3-like isoform X2 [Lineus longissimus]|uniref:golgin subfamily A member 3-like isoform X2 n=1 Tax=Lineus longissimus TaxID=88925 RepID=UPI002B4D0725